MPPNHTTSQAPKAAAFAHGHQAHVARRLSPALLRHRHLLARAEHDAQALLQGLLKHGHEDARELSICLYSLILAYI